MAKRPVVSSATILDALARRYAPPEWALIREVRVGTGFVAGPPSSRLSFSGIEQRLDAWAVHCYPAGGIFRVAFEVKASRGDWVRELKAPAKRAAAMMLAEEFFFVLPDGIAVASEVPDGCGLIRVGTDGACRVVVAAPHRQVDPIPLRFLASVIRTAAAQGMTTLDRLARAEAEAAAERRYHLEVREAAVEAMAGGPGSPAFDRFLRYWGAGVNEARAARGAPPLLAEAIEAAMGRSRR